MRMAPRPLRGGRGGAARRTRLPASTRARGPPPRQPLSRYLPGAAFGLGWQGTFAPAAAISIMAVRWRMATSALLLLLLLLLSAVCHLAAVPASSFPPRPGNLRTSSGSFALPGGPCGNQTITIAFPVVASGAGRRFPVVSYGHGTGGSMPWDLLNDVASLGIVVFAPEGWCDDQWKDMVHAVSGSRRKPLHPVLAHIDWAHVGFLGHSAGGYAACTAAAYASTLGTGITPRAVVASHGADIDGSKNISCPSMFSSGSADPRRHKSAQAFANCPARPKVFAVLEGGSHMEPERGGHLNPYDAHFLACHLNVSTSSCDKIYGDGPATLCHANNMSTCDVVTTPAPAPPPPNPDCQFEDNTDFDSGSQQGKHGASSREECCELCKSNQTCVAAVFDPAFRHTPASCWFKTAGELAKKVTKPGVTACVLKNPPPAPPPAPPPPNPDCQFEDNTDFDSGSQQGKHGASSKEECCELCKSNQTCAAAVFDPAFRHTPASCWFKTAGELAKKVTKPGVTACVPAKREK
eukprot:COSAG06_NODE_1515_length_9225_cov_75.448280_3_plen_522_part_00